MELIMVQAITEVALPGIPKNGFNLDNECVICPVDAGIRSLAKDGLVPFIGLVHADTLMTAGAVSFVPQHSDEDIAHDSAKLSLLRMMGLTQLFLFCLWLIKDNSANTGDGHFLLLNDRKGPVSASTQRPGVLNFTADCHRVDTSFSETEVNDAVALFAQLLPLIPTGEWKFDEPRPSGLTFDSRVVRVIYYAMAARASAEIAVKLAYQCICFESLCASSSDSISHRVSERVAVLIGRDAADSRAVYGSMRDLYNRRSTVVHGAPLKPKDLPRLRELAKEADDCLRRTLSSILASKELLELFSKDDSKTVDEFFLKRIFPDPPKTSSTGQA